jgi:hypothetical protein
VALAAMGAGAASVAVGGIIVLATPRRVPVNAGLYVGPTGAVAAGGF